MRRTVARRLMAPALAVCLAAAAAGCQQAFTTSLAKPLARSSPPAPSTITATQAVQYADEIVSNGDTKQAQAIMPAMAKLVAESSGNAAVLTSAIQTASVATGVETAFINALDVVPVDDLTKGNLSSAQITEVAALLTDITVTDDTTAIYSALADADPAKMAASGTNATQYAVASIALVIADAKSQNLDVAALMNEPTPFSSYTPSTATNDLVTKLMNNAQAQWPDDKFVTGMQDVFGSALP